MANENHDSSSTTTLPEDTIIMEILPYLPAKSVGRFRSVSHTWRAALSSATFVDLHLRRANTNRQGQPRLFFCPSDAPPEEEEEEEAYLHIWQPGGPATKLTPKPKEFRDPAIMTRPVRGLHLVRSKAGYFVYNPSTGSSLLLPDSKASLKMSRRHETATQPEPPYFYDVCYGLGYCSVTGEYKAVRLFSGSYLDGHPPCCEVYVLDRPPACWRPAAHQPPLMCTVWEGNPGVFLDDGYLYFLCEDDDIITFRVSDETFGSLPPPSWPSDPEDAVVQMVELNGRLCVCHAGDDGMYRMWTLGDHEPRRQWEQLCCIDVTAWTEPELMRIKSDWVAPLYMFNSDDDGRRKIMCGTGNCKVFTMDANGGTLESIFGAEDAVTGTSFVDCDHPSLGLFQESLVPVGRTVEEIVLSSPATRAWFHILKWMPARSVADLILVCREWRAMIMIDRFIQSHVLHANLNKSPRIMMIISPPDERCIDLENFIDLDAPGLGPGFACSQPCHGLSVGSSRTGSFVCNPITAYCKNIPFEDGEDASFAGRIGLGYNSETSKHVLVLTSYKEKNMITLEYQLECKMPYVEEREWRPIDPPPRPILASTPPTHFSGKICWLVAPNLGQDSPNYEIVAFNVQAEEFEVIQGPRCSHPIGRMSILYLQGALCVAFSNLNINAIDIWMMKDNNGTWLRECHIDLSSSLRSILQRRPHHWLSTQRTDEFCSARVGHWATMTPRRLHWRPSIVWGRGRTTVSSLPLYVKKV